MEAESLYNLTKTWPSFFLNSSLVKKKIFSDIYLHTLSAFRYNFSWEIKYSLYSQETRNSQKKNRVLPLEILVVSILKKFAIHKKNTGYCLWKFWFSLLSKNSQFTKNQQGTAFGNFGYLYSQKTLNSLGNFGSLYYQETRNSQKKNRVLPLEILVCPLNPFLFF